MLLTLIALHGAALAAVLLFARRDVVLVDEHGRLLDPAGPWFEQAVPATADDAVAA